jgi:hypothetical protein
MLLLLSTHLLSRWVDLGLPHYGSATVMGLGFVLFLPVVLLAPVELKNEGFARQVFRGVPFFGSFVAIGVLFMTADPPGSNDFQRDLCFLSCGLLWLTYLIWHAHRCLGRQRL